MAAGSGKGNGKKGGIKEIVKTMNKSYQEMTPLMNGIAKKLNKGGFKKGS